MIEILLKEELDELESHKKFHIAMSRSMLKIGAFISIISPFMLYFKGITILDYLFLFSLTVVINLFLWYYLFGQKYLKLKRDIKQNEKITKIVALEKIVKGNNDDEFKFENGFVVSSNQLEDINFNLLEIGNKVAISYAPRSKIILKIVMK